LTKITRTSFTLFGNTDVNKFSFAKGVFTALCGELIDEDKGK